MGRVGQVFLLGTAGGEVYLIKMNSCLCQYFRLDNIILKVVLFTSFFGFLGPSCVIFLKILSVYFVCMAK